MIKAQNAARGYELFINNKDDQLVYLFSELAKIDKGSYTWICSVCRKQNRTHDILCKQCSYSHANDVPGVLGAPPPPPPPPPPSLTKGSIPPPPPPPPPSVDIKSKSWLNRLINSIPKPTMPNIGSKISQLKGQYNSLSNQQKDIFKAGVGAALLAGTMTGLSALSRASKRGGYTRRNRRSSDMRTSLRTSNTKRKTRNR